MPRTAFDAVEPAPEVNPFVAKRLGIVFWVCIGWIALVVGSALLAPFLPFPDPVDAGARTARSAPLDGSILGGDSLGRDMLSRVAWGARVSIAVAFMSVAFGLIVGGFLGVVSGYFRGKVDGLIMGTIDAVLAFPPLILALGIVTFLAEGRVTLFHVTLAIGLLSAAPISRLMRASTLQSSQREFVLAARASGAKHWRIISREILPNIILPTISFALIGVAYVIVAEGTLGFLGLSVTPPTPTWGAMINDGRRFLRDAPHISLVPAAVMFLTVLALNFIGDALAEKFQAREGVL